MSDITQFLHKTFEEVEEYGKANNYKVYKTYSEPAWLIVPADMKSVKDRLEVRMYAGLKDDTYVWEINRYKDGECVEYVSIK
jgi:hypothetical protein